MKLNTRNFRCQYIVLFMFFSLPFSAYSQQNDQGFIPKNRGYSEYNIDMRQLFESKRISGSWSTNSGRIRVDVKNGCKVTGSGVHNYFSSSAYTDDPSMIINPAPKVVAENRYLKIYFNSEIGANGRIADLPWQTEPGDGSERFRCSLLSSFGIYSARKGGYTIELKRPFSMEDRFNHISILIFGGRALDKQDTPPIISTIKGDEISEVRFNFINWYSPYSCNLKLSDPVIDFGTNTPKKLIAGVDSKTLNLNLSCTSKSANLDRLAASIEFVSELSDPNSDYFLTTDPDTGKINKNLVFIVYDINHKKNIKNMELIKFNLNQVNEQKSESEFNLTVTPKWIGGNEKDIPIGKYSSTGIIYFNLE